MAIAKAKAWDVGNLFAVPLLDGSFALGQVIGREASVLNSITVALYRTRVSSEELAGVDTVPRPEEIISIQFTTKDLLVHGVWRVLGNFAVVLPREVFPYEHLRSVNWIGAKVVGAGILRKLLNAYFCLEPWDQMMDPAYFDSLLVSLEVKPEKLAYQKSHSANGTDA